MKKNLPKSFTPSFETTVFRKPLGFCCGVNDLQPFPQFRRQDQSPPIKRNPLAGPNIKISVQERAPVGRPISGSRRASSARPGVGGYDRSISLGGCKRCSGPLQWYLEDEITAARDILANKRHNEYVMETRRIIASAKEREKMGRRDTKTRPPVKKKRTSSGK